MNYCADSALTMSDEAFPLSLPTSRINWGTIAVILSFKDPSKKDDKCILAVSFQALNLLDKESTLATKEMFDGHIQLVASHYMPRHDFIQGKWVTRPNGTLEYDNATYEDSIFSLASESQAFAIVKFRRML